MSKAQREKGKAGERELAALFRECGFNARRTSQYCGRTGDASDVVGLPGIHVECKRCETTKIHEWMAQARRDAKEGIPAVFHRRSREKWLVTMDAEDFLEVLSERRIANTVLELPKGDEQP